MPTTTLMTAEELWQMPNGNMRHELVRGELRTMAPAGFDHGSYSVNVLVPLGQFVREHNLGIVLSSDTGFILARNPDTVRAPDCAFVGKEKLARIGRTEKFFPAAPDLAVEVVSPSDTVVEVDEKIQEYLDAGVRLLWIVLPRRRTVTVYRPGCQPMIVREDETLEGYDILPGLRLSVREIFT